MDGSAVRLRATVLERGSFDGVPHATVAAAATHDVWALDEYTIPVLFRQWDLKEKKWVSAQADAVIIVDVCSGAIVGVYVADPGRRLDEDGLQMRSGFDRDDVLAALLSAASPQLADDATREFSGYLPRRLRWDNAQAHKSLERWLKNQGLEIDARRIPKRRAISNGAAERRVGISKSWFADMRGHVDEYVATDRIDNAAAADLAGHRTNAAGGTGDRAPRRIPILPEQLMTLDELREEVSRIVRLYCSTHVNSRTGVTAADRYHQMLPSNMPHEGKALVRALDVQATTVRRDGILHYAHNKEYQFFPVVDGALLLLDTPVYYYADPVGRGIFVHGRGNHLEFLEPRRLVRRDDGAASVIARNQAAIAKQFSDEARDARLDLMIRMFGEFGLADAERTYRAAVARFKAIEAGDENVPDLPAAMIVPVPAEALETTDPSAESGSSASPEMDAMSAAPARVTPPAGAKAPSNGRKRRRNPWADPQADTFLPGPTNGGSPADSPRDASRRRPGGNGHPRTHPKPDSPAASADSTDGGS